MDPEINEPRANCSRFKRAKTHWKDVILVCKKCSKKVKGGFGEKGRERLYKAMRKELGLKKGREAEVGFIEVDCLDICPKNAVTVLRGAEPEAFLIIPAKTPLPEVATALGLERVEKD